MFYLLICPSLGKFRESWDEDLCPILTPLLQCTMPANLYSVEWDQKNTQNQWQGKRYLK